MAQSKRQVARHANEFYCRRCQEHKTARHFYKATDEFLDRNGYMSICKECINCIYSELDSTRHNINLTILEICRILNVKFSENALSATKQQMETYKDQGKDITNIFGMYKSRLISVLQSRLVDRGQSDDLTFYEPPQEVVEILRTEEDRKDLSYYEEKWGGASTHLGMEDYEFLEQELAEWKSTTKHDTYAKEVYLREICFLRNDIRRARLEGKPYDKLLKSFIDMSKEGALTPVQQSKLNSSESMAAFGVWIKDVENKEPAEVWQDMGKYHDMDGIEEDWADMIRSTRNFMTDSRDFTPLEIEEALGTIDYSDEDLDLNEEDGQPDDKEK